MAFGRIEEGRYRIEKPYHSFGFLVSISLLNLCPPNSNRQAIESATTMGLFCISPFARKSGPKTCGAK
eukprot:scaffold11142_cov130-Skeletonema_dohrnii-CCMP3373.AAC.1